MSTLFALLPLYLFGNLHCLGMCGPLVMMLGQHPHRYGYFVGRLLSYTLAGTLAGEMGAVLNLYLTQYHLSAIMSFLFGGAILTVGVCSLMHWSLPNLPIFTRNTRSIQNLLALLILREKLWPTMLFGFLTVALPCGQTVIVFSACALSGSAWIGMLNGFTFALLTSPSLFFAMNTHTFLQKIKKHYNILMGSCAIIVGLFACCRGLAELNLMQHWILNPEAAPHYHIVMY